MSIQKSSLFNLSRYTRRQVGWGLILVYQLASVLLLLAILVFSISWWRQPVVSRGIELAPLPFINLSPAWRIINLAIPYATGLIYLIIAIWVLLVRREDPSSQAFSFCSTSCGLAVALLTDVYAGQRLLPFWTISLALAAGSLVDLALVFPEPSRWLKRFPFLRPAGIVLSGLVLAYSIYFLFQGTSQAYQSAWRVEFYALGLAFLILIGLIAERRWVSSSPIIREQSRLVLWSLLVSLAPWTVWQAVHITGPVEGISSSLSLSLSIFPVVSAYTILRYRFLKTDYLASRFVLYGLLLMMIVVAYGLIASGLALIGANLLDVNNPILTGAILFLCAILLIPMRNALQNKIDEAFSRGQLVYREKLQTFSRELTKGIELGEILGILRQYAEEGVHPAQLHIFVHDPLSEQYLAANDDTKTPTSGLRFSPGSPVVQTLGNHREAIFLGAEDPLPPALRSERARLAMLNTQLYIPLPGRNALTGWMALGPRRSGEPFTDQDLNFLESLCDQAALAIERAQVVSNLERRMREMNILTRVSQGINITLAFDDILELIFAQTSQLIPVVDFYITLHDSYNDYLYYVYDLENDERYTDRENKPLPVGQGLEQDILHSRSAIISDDYERECRSRGVLPAVQGLFAWLGVPLNAGAETIGVMSLGSRDSSVLYTDEQKDLLQAIADQAAGAIVKARLLQESQRRTRQLTSLNDVARNLTSTLELNKLLNQILNNAVEILNCEAGTLFLIDKHTDELIFEVVASPVANELMGKRLPAGTGLAGKAVETGQPIIANDVHISEEWYRRLDQETGFVTQNLLVVPMLVQDRVTGVIEVINRKDGLSFTQDDQELLIAFTSQAAVAIENARLYTLTDQALTARVEELSVMQRIDRELNASLDIAKTMQITLGWAMRQSGAEAGWVGMLEENGIRVMAQQGYAGELEGFREGPLPIELQSIQSAVETGQPQCLNARQNLAFSGFLTGAQEQVAIPIRHESRTAGLIFLESKRSEALPEETLLFLTRLSDHAAVAITNARLYAEVQAANLAKSEFVSFVSHELKTPMTSIKGFTDLIAAGAVGPVNEAQANFLNTIRSNVDRMATLVSDLADVSRIEAGRLRLDFAAVPVAEIVNEVARSVRGQVEAKKQKLSLDIPASLPPMWGDRTRLIQVLTNLTSNAYKYSPENGSISIHAEMVQNEWDPNGAPYVIHLSVQDTGFGISEEDQKRIFQKFFRSEDQAIRDAPGTGLGLNITKTLVEMQGGQIWFVSNLRQGTTFHLTVPVAATA